MIIYKRLFFLYITFFTFIICNKIEEEKFEPTNEWKIVKPGQRLPPGLHIRHDFTKKITEAKILDHSEKNENSAIITTQEIDEKSDFGEGIKEENGNLNRETNNKFRSYEELKEQLGLLNMTVKSDSELIRELFDRYMKLLAQEGFDNSEEFLSILIDLEYLTHQIDNGLNFVNLDGIKKIIFPSLKFENDELKNEALKLFSAVLQHNPKTQIRAFELNSISVLLKVMFKDRSNQVSVNALSALISLLRRFPTAQLSFIQLTGLSNLANYLNNIVDDKFESKVFSLLTDLVSDNINYNISENKNNSNIISKSIILYLKENMVNQQWCDRIKNSLSNKFHMKSHSFVENIFSLINITNKMCNQVYNELSFQEKIKNVLVMYDNLSKIEIEENTKLVQTTDTDFYFTHLRDNIKNIMLEIFNSSYDKDKWRDEL